MPGSRSAGCPRGSWACSTTSPPTWLGSSAGHADALRLAGVEYAETDRDVAAAGTRARQAGHAAWSPRPTPGVARHDRSRSPATWSPDPLGEGQHRLSLATSLVAEARGALMSAGSIAGWTGPAAAEAAAVRHADLNARLDRLDDALRGVEPALARAADRLALSSRRSGSPSSPR